MCIRRRSHFCLDHPVLCGMLVGFAAIGVCGVAMAVKKKGKKLGRAAGQAGSACVESVREMAANAMEDGIQKVDGLVQKVQGKQSSTRRTRQAPAQEEDD